MATTFHVRTVGAGIIRDGRILADDKAEATKRAIFKHRERLNELARSADRDRLGRTEAEATLKARTASILVSVVETITFTVGDTITPKDAA